MQPYQEQEDLLKRFIIDNRDFDELEAKIFRFNVFEAVGMVRQEIKHSNFLQFLLNPLEKHQLDDLFLKKLLIEVLRNAEVTSSDDLDIANFCFDDANIRREWRYIDLLIHSPSNNFVCVIENKVDSTEGFNQLQTYQSVIDREFPYCKKLFIYLTKEGDTASQSEWLSLSYGTIANIIEKICEERQSSLSPDIEISMRHYVDLIRRHLMSESDIAELCRKIYKEHRQAIDLIYEHRPDMRSDVEACLTQLIQEFAEPANLDLDSVQGKWIRFAPKEWDTLAFQSACSSGWSKKQRLLLLEFWNDPQSLELRLVIGPGDKKFKQPIYQKLCELGISGLKRCKNREISYTQAYGVQVLNPTDYEEGNLQELQDKIRDFWLTYINGDLKVIRNAIFEEFEKTTD
ncbi:MULTISPECIES: PD-(D/E)XK nuclease family protein [Cyanophyceae]|uniref:PD-(D/E)XK nuclease family protein n=1 Tax=Leptolyngbya subtilissima DQ-A4 TaxID=2933933 RepID=A0ABV0JZQ1_9CYAN|nr:PD-(D/E)XK nuclease family protein [Nodosilinea sp. FACHB-141]MBD2112546.1 PD-(D/E)XK nuclease family protein [Nodosilinea sp. FACHB-141]